VRRNIQLSCGAHLFNLLIMEIDPNTITGEELIAYKQYQMRPRTEKNKDEKDMTLEEFVAFRRGFRSK